MKFLKIFGSVLALLILLFLFLANFSAKEVRYSCEGKITANGIEQGATVFLKLQRYRWWVGLWSDSQGSAWIEIPNQTVDYYEHLTEAGDMLQFWGSARQDFSGVFSTLSSTLGVNIRGVGVFDGTCKEIKQ